MWSSKWLRVAAFACALVLSCLFASTSRAALTQEELQSFVDEEIYGGKDDPEWPVLRLLKANVPKPGLDTAIDKVASRWKLQREAAAALSEALILDEINGAYGDEAVSKRAMSAYLAAVDAEPTSTWLWNLVLAQADSNEMCDFPGLAERYFSNAQVSRDFLEPDGECEELIFVYAKSNPMTPLAWRKLDEALPYDGVLQAAVTRVFLRAVIASGASSEVVDLARRDYLINLSEVPPLQEFVREIDALSPGDRSRLLMQRPSGSAKLQGYEIKPWHVIDDGFEELRGRWIVALLEVGRPEEARQWLADFKLPAAGKRAAKDDHLLHDHVYAGRWTDQGELLRHVVSGPGNTDPFDLFVGDGERGLLWSSDSWLHWRRVAARHMQAARYPAIAASLEMRACERLSWSFNEPVPEMPADLPAELVTAIKEIDALRLAAREAEPECSGKRQETASTVERRQYQELPVPEALRRPPEKAEAADDADDEQESAADASTDDESRKDDSLPESVRFVRVEKNADHIIGISVSQDVDPVGELPTGGYWLQRSTDGGKTWQRPLYLGLRQYQPYVVTARSNIPLLDGRTLRLEVEVQEIDEATISFPPVGLAMKRQARDLYIELSIDELERDTDGDELPDLLEEKLRTNPAVADTDGDGIKDGYDDMPQVSALAPPHELAPLIALVMKEIAGFEAAAVPVGVRTGKEAFDDWIALIVGGRKELRPPHYLFIVGDPSLFNGLVLPVNAIVLSEEDLRWLDARYGPHYPMDAPDIWVRHSGDRAVVQWSAQWTGGTIELTRKGDRWVSKVITQWIT
jgi:hypothetical protein